MIKVFYVLAFALLGWLAWRRFREGLEAEDDPLATTPWRLNGSLIWAVLGGSVMAFFFLRALIRGEVDCSMKGGRCEVEVFVRAIHPKQYWFNVGFYALGAAVLFWIGWRVYRRWHESHD